MERSHSRPRSWVRRSATRGKPKMTFRKIHILGRKEKIEERERERVIGCFAEVGNKFRRSLSGEKGIIFVATFGKHTDHIANCAGEGKRPFGNLRRRREQLTTGGGRSIGGGREHHWGRAKARLAWRCRGKQHRWGRRGDLRQHLEGLKGKAKERVSRK